MTGRCDGRAGCVGRAGLAHRAGLARLPSSYPARLLFGIATASLLWLAAPSPASGLPRMALLAGAPCATCHVAPQGGGLRSDMGWTTMNGVGAFGWHQVGLKSLAALESNGWVDGRLFVGADVRFQNARLGRPAADGTLPARRGVPMQMQPYLGTIPVDWLTAYGSVNLAALPPYGHNYAGQSAWEAVAQIQPNWKWPILRVGQLQPTIGIRHDDHTMLLRADAARPRNPLIPPGYAELGGELSYQPKPWVQAQAGVFATRNLALADSTGAVHDDDVAWAGRAVLSPQLHDWGVNTWLGAGLHQALRSDYRLETYFAGVGRNELGALFVEVSRSLRGSGWRTLNAMSMLSWQARTWLVIEARAERATTDDGGGGDYETSAVVGGVQFFPLPFIELRPEYRYLRVRDERGAYAMGQYTLQVHLFF